MLGPSPRLWQLMEGSLACLGTLGLAPKVVLQLCLRFGPAWSSHSLLLGRPVLATSVGQLQPFGPWLSSQSSGVSCPKVSQQLGKIWLPKLGSKTGCAGFGSVKHGSGLASC
uniref:Uncharacterized protein n=1 Tax=Opuntia streptacantha TaxID=393608 RepID=A0A7C9DKF0_OPUST